EQARFAIRLEVQPLVSDRLEKYRGVELVACISVVGAEHQRYAIPIHKPGGGLVELRSIGALRRAERRRVHGLWPDKQIELPLRGALQERIRQREVRVEDQRDGVVGAESGGELLVMADVALHDAGAHRRGGWTIGEITVAPCAVREQDEDEQCDAGERGGPYAHSCSGRVRRGDGAGGGGAPRVGGTQPERRDRGS